MNAAKNNMRPWIVMGAIGIISAACLGSSMVPMGSFLPSLATAMHASAATISYYYTILVLVMAAMMQVVPRVLASVNNSLVYLAATVLITASLFDWPHQSAVDFLGYGSSYRNLHFLYELCASRNSD